MAKVRCHRDASGQLIIEVRNSHGGARRGAGRKPRGRRPGVAHRRRSDVKRGLPVRIETRAVPEIGNLQKRKVYQAVRKALVLSCRKRGFRVCHFSVRKARFELIVEADSARALHKGMTGLLVRIARRANGLASRRGQVFPERYRHRVMKTPSQVRDGLRQVMRRPCGPGAQGRAALHRLQQFSSARYFDGWSKQLQEALLPPGDDPPPVAEPRTWLLTAGWRERGLLGSTDLGVPQSS